MSDELIYVVTRDNYESAEMLAAFRDYDSADKFGDTIRESEKQLAAKGNYVPYGVTVHKVTLRSARSL